MASLSRSLLGGLLGMLVLPWVRSFRVRVEWQSGVPPSDGRRVLAFFHGHQMALLGAARRRTAILVSHSADGDVQSAVMRRLGFSVVRGSSSRGGAAGMRALLRRLRRGEDVAFAVDGPRGPRGVAKPGAAMAARASGAALLPVAAATSRALVVSRAWDRFEIPWPFSRVAVVVGPPVSVGPDEDTARIAAAIRAARGRAEAILDGRAREKGT